MSDCARHMQPPESERERKSGEQRTRERKTILFSESCTSPPGCCALSELTAAVRERFIQKSISPSTAQGRASRQHCVVECARDACLLCTRRRAHTMHAQQIYKRERRRLFTFESGGSERAARVVFVRGYRFWCSLYVWSLVFVCCHRAYLVQGENIRVYYALMIRI
jgi:hypothetical protein